MFDCSAQLRPQSVVTKALLFGSVVGVIAYKIFKKRYNLPPGPKGWPLIGNLLDIRGSQLSRKLRDWSKTYGPVMRIQLGTLPAIVLSRIDVVTEALITRQADFAGRPHTFAAYTLSGEGKDIAQASYGPRWKLHRKIASKALRHYLMGDNLSRKVSQSLKITTNLMRMEQGAFDPSPYLSLAISNMMTGMLFNKISADLNSEYYRTYVVTLDAFMQEAGEGFLEDSIPPLRLCPTPKFRDAVRLNNKILGGIREEIAAHRNTFRKDKIRDFTDALIQAQQEAEERDGSVLMSQITNTHMVMTIFDLLAAGIDTSRNTLHWCLLVMALHPDIQKKVQEEVDSVIGGYEVPKGTMVIINHDALHFDPDQWEDVDIFKPERFLDSDGKMGPKPDSWLPFSAGRRVCLGETVAKPEIHLFLAGILRVFTMSLAPGTPTDFEPQSKMFANCPKKYKLVMKWRV